MSHLATGVDLIEIERVSAVIERFGHRFLNRVFTSRELIEVGDNVVSLAARFAAKESVAKANSKREDRRYAAGCAAMERMGARAYPSIYL